MQRLKDYMNFMAWFAGLAYGLWRTFAQETDLPMVLHAIGMTALVFALAQLVLRILHCAAGDAAPIEDAPKPAARDGVPESWPSVKPRAQFGLRVPPR